MFLKRIAKLGQRGDTIIEVLMAIVVVSTVLGGAFVTTNKSLVSSRDAQERSSALKVAESQLERVKSLSTSNPSAISGATPPFCISGTNTVVSTVDAACRVNSNGDPTALPPLYNLSITRDNATSTYTITITWESARGGLTDTLQLSYRVYQ